MANPCACTEILPVHRGLIALVEESIEFISEPSLDELSDIVYTINRIAGALVRRKYVRLLPGDTLHIRKVLQRLETYGCVRSTRHLVQGRCPSKGVSE